MVIYLSLLLNWILFLALFPISFIWLKRSYKILIQKNYSEIALRKGLSPKNPKKYVTQTVIANTLGSVILISTVIGVVIFATPFEVWTAIAGSTIICKLFFDFALSWRAHIVNKT